MDQQQANANNGMCTAVQNKKPAFCSQHSDDKLIDFVILNSGKDKYLSEKFYTVLEDDYKFKGCHGERDLVVGRLRNPQIAKTLQTTKFVIELISKHAKKDRPLKRLRSIAHSVECEKGTRSYPEVLPIFIDVPREDQRTYTSTVGRTYSDEEDFWKELSNYMRGIHPFPASPNSPGSANPFDSSYNSDVSNNNKPNSVNEDKVKYRKKHKVFRGLFRLSKRNKKNSTSSVTSDEHFSKPPKRSFKRKKNKKEKKKDKQKSKKKLKSLRKFLRKRSSKSKTAQIGSTGVGDSPSVATIVAHCTTARQESVECDQYAQSYRMEVSR